MGAQPGVHPGPQPLGEPSDAGDGATGCARCVDSTHVDSTHVDSTHVDSTHVDILTTD